MFEPRFSPGKKNANSCSVIIKLGPLVILLFQPYILFHQDVLLNSKVRQHLPSKYQMDKFS